MKKEYSLGLVSVSFRQHKPRQILEAMKAAGLSVIEWGSDIHAPVSDSERISELSFMQNEYGIKCSSYGTYFHLGQTPISELEGYMNGAKLLDTNILRLWCGTKRGADMSEKEKFELLKACLEANEMAKKYDVKLCMECHVRTFTENPLDAVWLMETVNSPHFRMYWQPFQWQSEKENYINAETISPYAEHIHVFNWKGEKTLPLSDAVDEWREYLKRFDTPRTLLLEFMPNGGIDELKAEAEALRLITGQT